MAGEKRERKEERGLAGSTQMGYDAFSLPKERELTLMRASKNYGKNSVLKMLVKKIKLTKKEKTKKILTADYELVQKEVP